MPDAELPRPRFVGAARPVPAGFEHALEAEAAGMATPVDLELLESHRDAWCDAALLRLDDTELALASVRQLTGEEREQVVADFEDERARWLGVLERLGIAPPAPTPVAGPSAPTPPDAVAPVEIEPGEVRLHASWLAGRIVVWAAGPGVAPADGDELADRLEAAGAPAHGWDVHPMVPLPSGEKAEARVIPVHDVLGWLVAIGAGQVGSGETGGDVDEHVGASLRWFGRIAVWAVQLLARGSLVPVLRTRRAQGRVRADRSESQVRWLPGLVDKARLNELARTMPGPITAVEGADGHSVVNAVLEALVHAVGSDAAARIELPAPPPSPRTTAAVAESFLTRLDGSPFDAPSRASAEVASRLLRWAHPLTDPVSGRLLVQLDPPDSGGAWFLRVLGPDPDGRMVAAEVAMVDGRSKRLAEELTRLERLLPVLLRPGGTRRGEVYLDQSEAWELMTEIGPTLESAGFDVRVPALSRRKPVASLRLTSLSSEKSVVGAHQLADVRWTAVFGDVELDAAEIARLAREARPLVRSGGRWVALDKADLAAAQEALAERASKTRLSGAEMLRHAVGLEGSPLAGGITVEGTGWAADLLAQASELPSVAVATPTGFVGELRSYQEEAVAWLGFLDRAGLGGCLALDMGLGKTPTVLAHLLQRRGEGASLVVAPPAVVGNWAAEAARFTPELRVVIHHGASRASADELATEVAGADLVITTYGTAVRDVDALAELAWRSVILDEAQAVKNPTSETAQTLRRIPATIRLAMTGTPVENGLGDLWAILDFANPGLLGTRSAFVSQLSGSVSGNDAAGPGGRSASAAESALRALNGLLVFRRTKSEPIVAAELPDRIDELDRCTMTPEQIGLYQAVLDRLVTGSETGEHRQGEILAAITALKQICNHPAAYQDDGRPLEGRSGKLARLDEIVEAVFASGEKVLVFTHFAEWGKRLAEHLTTHTGTPVACYHGGLARGARDRLIAEFQASEGPGALVLSLKAGGTGLNLTAASHVVLYDRWWNPAVEDQARDRAWRIGQTRTVVSHRLVCPGTVDERVEEVVAGKRHIADVVLPKSSSLADLDVNQLRTALGIRPDALLVDDVPGPSGDEEEAA
jgi:superfamily II DNA or RNA helicase